MPPEKIAAIRKPLQKAIKARVQRIDRARERLEKILDREEQQA